MTKKFNNDDIQKIARLSSLELSESEVKNFSKQFYKILEYFEILDELDITKKDNYNSNSDIKSGRIDEV